LGYLKGTNNIEPFYRGYDLNFFAFGTFSPLNNLSAPTFLPLLGQPRLTEHELIKKMANVQIHTRREIRIDFISMGIISTD
jgi:hypothetical protein